VLDELLNHHNGTLRDITGEPIDLFADFRDGMDVFEWSWGGDWGRSMRRVLERSKRPFRNRLKHSPKLLMRILLLHYAREIRRARTQNARSAEAAAAV